MPNKIDEFTPDRIMTFVETRLRGISRAMGYNCDVFVTDDFDEANASQAKHTVYFDTPGGGTDEQGVGGEPLVNPTLSVEIGGSSFYETEHPRRLAMALEQDVRTALHNGIKELRASIGKGAAMRFGDVTYYKIVLKSKKEAGFLLTVSFTWSQKGDW